MKKTFRDIVSVFLLLLAGCGADSLANPTGRTGEQVFKPPTQPVVSETAGVEEPLSLTAQPTPYCQNGLAFLADVTIPDGTLVSPGAPIEKTWEVENVGTCSWNAAYSLRLVGGSNLGVESSLPLYPARPGTRASITIQFTAPAESGTIHSAWRAYGADGQPFGDTVYVQVNVSSQP